jgi:hypothetical protein
MSQQNVEVVRAFWRAWLDGDTAPLSVSGGEVVYDHRRDPDGLFVDLDPAVEVHRLRERCWRASHIAATRGCASGWRTWLSIGNRCGSSPASSWMRERPS